MTATNRLHVEQCALLQSRLVMLLKSSYKVFGRKIRCAVNIEIAGGLAILAHDVERLPVKVMGFLRQKCTSCLPTAATSTNPTVTVPCTN